MDETYKIIGEFANILATHNKKLRASALASLLNAMGIKNSSGNKYVENGRGIYRTIKCAYKEHENNNILETAYHIADSFIDSRGKPAWKH